MKTLRFFVILMLAMMMLNSCDNMTTSFGLNIGGSDFNRLGSNGQFELVPGNVFHQGEVIYMMLFDVTGFKPGEDNLHMLDMDMVIKDANGKEIYSENEMLGENGHVALPNNTAANPHVSFNPSKDMPAGEYTFYVKIYDKVGGGHASVSKKFTYQ